MGGSIPEQIVDAIHDIGGRHDGTRAVHAKGVVCAGTFTATPEGGLAHTRGAHAGRASPRDGAVLERRRRPGHARPREGRPRPGREALPRRRHPHRPGRDHASALLRQERGRLPRVHAGAQARPRDGAARHGEDRRLPRGTPRGAARDPARALAARPGQLRAARVPRDTRVQVDRCRTATERWIRFSFRPLAGVAGLSDEEAAERSDDYLQEEIRERLAREPVEFELEVAIAREGDDPDDPTEPWPDDRERVVVGTLRVEELDRTRERDGDVLVFDPTRVHGRHRAVGRSRSCTFDPMPTRCPSSAAAGRGASERRPASTHSRRGDHRGREPGRRVAAHRRGPGRANRERGARGLPAAVGPRAGGRRVRLGAHAPDDPDYAKAREVARRLGEAGFAIITGGGPGIMEAANRGAVDAGRAIGRAQHRAAVRAGDEPVGHPGHGVRLLLHAQADVRRATRPPG